MQSRAGTTATGVSADADFHDFFPPSQEGELPAKASIGLHGALHGDLSIYFSQLYLPSGCRSSTS